MNKNRSIPQNTALILIDVQKGFDDPKWGQRNNPQAEKNIAKLLTAWRKSNQPIFHIKHNSVEPHSPLRPEQSGNDIKDIVAPLPGEPLITKTVNSALIGTNLEKQLRKQKIDTVVIVGLTTDHCVSTTSRMAGNLGFTVYVVSDATATFDRKGYNGKQYSAKMMHEAALVSLQNEFATIIDTNTLLATIAPLSKRV
ncbi:MAG TPA: cysteine hydrolase family protein [Candidatus Acidoferrales bacterium]|nr:cysteine hydrolase family protein [Candidatus Acidoferrales bacterium]